MSKWNENRRKAARMDNEQIVRGLRRPGGGGSGGHGKGPHSDTCPANERLRKLLSRIPVGRPGNVVFCGMQYPAKCEAWFNSREDAG